MHGQTVLGIDPGRVALAAVAMRDGRVVYARSAALRGPPQAWEITLVEWIAQARPDVVVVEAQNFAHGPCAFVEGLARGIAVGCGITVVRHIPRAMHAQCKGFGTYRVNKRRAVEIVTALIPAETEALRAAQAESQHPERTDTFDAALFVLWHTRSADVKSVPPRLESCGEPKKRATTTLPRRRAPPKSRAATRTPASTTTAPRVARPSARGPRK